MSHGKRYTAKERKDILEYLDDHTYQETMDKFGVSQMSLARWVKNKKIREINTTSPLLSFDLLDHETQKEVGTYLKLLENSEKIRAAAVVTAAGELVLPESKGFQALFKNTEEIVVITTNFLLCVQGFCASVINEQKDKTVQFDDISVKTPVGIFLFSDVGQAVLVTLFVPQSSLQEIFLEEANFLTHVKHQLRQVLA